MQEYYFLFGMGILWSLFAVIQDLKTREVSNWLNFSLIGFGLVYRAFYSNFISDWVFFVSGLLGFAVFFVLAHLFYYSRVFAGGDAKLLMGFSVILPYGDFSGLFEISIVFVFVLFLFGAIWSLLYSVSVVRRNWEKFREEFVSRITKGGILFIPFMLFVILSLIVFDFVFNIIFSVFIFLIYLLYYYVRALDVCMIRNVNAQDLQEGDWLERDVRLKGRVIKKSVHGLNIAEIKLLKKAGKRVLIKDGVPFTPAFFFALIFMGFFVLVLEVSVFSLVFLF